MGGGPHSLIFLIDSTHADLCLNFNRALRNKYNGSVTIASAFDDSCVGEFARPTAANIIRGVCWQLKQLAENDIFFFVIIGSIPDVVQRVVFSTLQECKNKYQLVCMSTCEGTFKGLTGLLTVPVVSIVGEPSDMLSVFDGRPIVPMDIPVVSITTNGVEGDALASSVLFAAST